MYFIIYIPSRSKMVWELSILATCTLDMNRIIK